MNLHRHPSVPLSLFLVFTALIVFFAAGYGLMSLIYRWTGTPPDLWTHILSGLMGIILLWGLATVARLLISRFSKGRQAGSSLPQPIAECHDQDRPGRLRCLR